VVSGQWSVVSGQWSVVSGQWSEESLALLWRLVKPEFDPGLNREMEGNRNFALTFRKLITDH
jgi:hypothetical protein